MWRGYDGAGDVAEQTGGYVSFFDLTLPLSLPRADYVLSLEVGEHVPSKHEASVIRNLHAHNNCGILLSWAHLWQSGHHHVNNHGMDYLERVFTGLGYRRDDGLTNALRATSRRREAKAGKPARAPEGVPGRASGPIFDYFGTNAIAFNRIRPLSVSC